ncbi:MAG: DUF4399 domain-containing protein [Pseudomonadales bacterium]|nr:DUF4399 domain-containing protein [Pseudomonadales bacterium]
MKKCCVFIVMLALGFGTLAEELAIPLSASAEGASVYILEPADGAVVPATFMVKFGLHGMGVAPAGMEKVNTGHHHLLVDVAELPSLDLPLGGEVKHFGGGQTETELTLAPGTHTLQLIFADHRHIPHNPPLLSQKITITVLDESSKQDQ